MKGTKRKKSTDNVGSCKQRVGSQRKVGKKNKWTANSISDLVHHLEASVTSPTLIERDAPLTEREEKYLNSSKDPIAEVWKLSKRDLCGFFGLMGPEVYSKFYVRDKLNESDKLYLSDILRERVQEVRENLKVIKRVEMVLIRDYQNQDLLKEHKRQKEWVQVVIDLLRDFNILHHFTLSLCGRLFRLSFRIEHQETVVKSSYCYYFCIEENSEPTLQVRCSQGKYNLPVLEVREFSLPTRRWVFVNGTKRYISQAKIKDLIMIKNKASSIVQILCRFLIQDITDIVMQYVNDELPPIEITSGINYSVWTSSPPS